MKKGVIAVAAFVTGLSAPLAVQASEADLQLKLDNLTKDYADLKSKVEKNENKSLNKWLSIGGEYRFRVDSLRGETAPYSDAIGTMKTMVGDFLTGTNATAISGTNGFASYALMSETGKLFSPKQFNTILGTYMPNAMYGGFTSTAFLTQLNTMIGAGQPGIDGGLAGTALTLQQQSILNTMSKYGVLDKVFSMPASANIQMGGSQVAGATLGDQWNNMMTALAGMGLNPTQINQLAMQMMMQGFLGGNSPYLNKVPAYKPKNDTLYTNKFALDLTAKPVQNITVHARLNMYKSFGSQDTASTTGNYFSDRITTFDGTLGHIPSDSYLNVDRAYTTWSNIADEPIWFSVGRRPSTEGAPENLRLNHDRPGNGGTPALLVDYAFDGMTLGYAPDIEALPGAYAKICYGRGFDSGMVDNPSNSIKDTDMLGIAVIPVDTDPLRVWLQWNRGFDIFDFPVMKNSLFGDTAPSVNLGNIDWFGTGVMSTLKHMGPGTLQVFGDLGLSITHPNGRVSQNAGFQGLMTGEFFAQEDPSDKSGWAFYTGVRYDLPSKTKLGFEFNHGSKNWITFAPAADDMWTAKAGTRGNVYEPYIIQELDLKPISSYFAKAFFKIGYQYYDFEYTGSNNWVGAPKKISALNATDLMLLAPVKEAHDIYGTFEVQF